MKRIEVVARFNIHPGELAEFKQLVGECVALVKENEPGALRYSWFLSSDETQCVVLETYESSEALLAHASNVGETLGKLATVSDSSAEVFGDPSRDVVQLAETYAMPIYSFLQGIE